MWAFPRTCEIVLIVFVHQYDCTVYHPICFHIYLYIVSNTAFFLSSLYTLLLFRVHLFQCLCTVCLSFSVSCFLPIDTHACVLFDQGVFLKTKWLLPRPDPIFQYLTMTLCLSFSHRTFLYIWRVCNISIYMACLQNAEAAVSTGSSYWLAKKCPMEFRHFNHMQKYTVLMCYLVQHLAHRSSL